MEKQIKLFDTKSKTNTKNKTYQRDRVLKLLLNNEFVKSAELRLFCYCYTARVSELRRMGYIIKADRQNNLNGFALIGRVPSNYNMYKGQ